MVQECMLLTSLASTIMVFKVNKDGSLELAQTVQTTRAGFPERNSCAEILIGKDGKFLYGSNRGENTIVVFKIDKDGLLSLSGHVSCGGDWPRNFVIDASGRFLLSGNQKSGNITVLESTEELVPRGFRYLELKLNRQLIWNLWNR